MPYSTSTKHPLRRAHITWNALLQEPSLHCTHAPPFFPQTPHICTAVSTLRNRCLRKIVEELTMFHRRLSMRSTPTIGFIVLVSLNEVSGNQSAHTTWHQSPVSVTFNAPPNSVHREHWPRQQRTPSAYKRAAIPSQSSSSGRLEPTCTSRTTRGRPGSFPLHSSSGAPTRCSHHRRRSSRLCLTSRRCRSCTAHHIRWTSARGSCRGKCSSRSPSPPQGAERGQWRGY